MKDLFNNFIKWFNKIPSWIVILSFILICGLLKIIFTFLFYFVSNSLIPFFIFLFDFVKKSELRSLFIMCFSSFSVVLLFRLLRSFIDG